MADCLVVFIEDPGAEMGNAPAPFADKHSVFAQGGRVPSVNIKIHEGFLGPQGGPNRSNGPGRSRPFILAHQAMEPGLERPGLFSEPAQPCLARLPIPDLGVVQLIGQCGLQPFQAVDDLANLGAPVLHQPVPALKKAFRNPALPAQEDLVGCLVRVVGGLSARQAEEDFQCAVLLARVAQALVLGEGPEKLVLVCFVGGNGFLG